MDTPACDDELVEVLTTAGIGTQQLEALKAGLPAMGVTDLHSFAYARKALDPNGINSQHEREYAAGKVLRDARKGSSEVVADEAQASLLLVAHDLALKKMYNNVACLGGGPLYCTTVGGEEK